MDEAGNGCASDWRVWTRSQLDAVRSAGQWRTVTAFDERARCARIGGREVVNFASNDYLGLAAHPAVRAAAVAAIERWGTGAGASRLVTGTRSLHEELETAVADWQGAQRALVLPTGYAANIAVLTAFGAADATIFSDALNHASIIDGCRLAKARTVVFPHNDVEQLERLMIAAPGRKLVVTETVFSMDGDAAPLADMAELCARHDALLVVDEAHAVFGSAWGECPGISPRLVVGTFSKTFGALGGWVAGDAECIDLLINRARSFIFTTALTPADTAAAAAALCIYRGAEGAELRERLRSYVDSVKPGHASAILPIVLGGEDAALAASRSLLDRGLYVPAIRPPTVPPGSARLRVAFSAAHTQAQIDMLKSACAEVLGPDWPMKEQSA